MTDQAPLDSDDNWLRAEIFSCQSCGEKFFRVDQSPFDSAWRWYCNSCPRFVEIGFYDEGLPKKEGLERCEYLQLIESQLRTCECGGKYRREAHPRCSSCNRVLLEECGVDVHPMIAEDLYGDDARDPTEEEISQWDSWNKRLMRTENLWRVESP